MLNSTRPESTSSLYIDLISIFLDLALNLIINSYKNTRCNQPLIKRTLGIWNLIFKSLEAKKLFAPQMAIDLIWFTGPSTN